MKIKHGIDTAYFLFSIKDGWPTNNDTKLVFLLRLMSLSSWMNSMLICESSWGSDPVLWRWGCISCEPPSVNKWLWVTTDGSMSPYGGQTGPETWVPATAQCWGLGPPSQIGWDWCECRWCKGVLDESCGGYFRCGWDPYERVEKYPK